ncbi:MAG: Transcriptional regulator of rhamnose utilization, DeoR family, partial [uncultured Rubrobacteraceae bacterium]
GDVGGGPRHLSGDRAAGPGGAREAGQGKEDPWRGRHAWVHAARGLLPAAAGGGVGGEGAAGAGRGCDARGGRDGVRGFVHHGLLRGAAHNRRRAERDVPDQPGTGHGPVLRGGSVRREHGRGRRHVQGADALLRGAVRRACRRVLPGGQGVRERQGDHGRGAPHGRGPAGGGGQARHDPAVRQARAAGGRQEVRAPGHERHRPRLRGLPGGNRRRPPPARAGPGGPGGGREERV